MAGSSKNESKQDSSHLNSKENSNEIVFDEAFEGDGIFVGRAGRFILFQNTRTEEEHEKFLATIPKKLDEISKELRTKVDELKDILFGHVPFDLIANIKIRNAIIDVENFKEYESDINVAFTEYVSLLFLTESIDQYPKITVEPFIRGEFENIQHRIEELFQLTTFQFMLNQVDTTGKKKPSSLDHIRVQTLIRSLSVRYMYYFHHLKEVLLDLFQPSSIGLKKELGFTIEEAFQIAESVAVLEETRFQQRIDVAIEGEKKLKKAVRKFRQKKEKYI